MKKTLPLLVIVFVLAGCLQKPVSQNPEPVVSTEVAPVVPADEKSPPLPNKPRSVKPTNTTPTQPDKNTDDMTVEINKLIDEIAGI